MKEKNHKTFAQAESLFYKKAEELINSLTKKEKEFLESRGWELGLEEVFHTIYNLLVKRYDHQTFTLEQLKKDLKKLTKKEVFGL